MENTNRNCIIARLIILISSIILSIVVAGLFAADLFPLLPIVFPFTAGLAALIILAIYFAIVATSPYECVRRCVLCLGLMSLVAALALLVLSLVAIAVGLEMIGVLATIFVFFFALAFWIALIGFLHFTRCLAYRN